LEINVSKRNGKLVPFDADKINETLEWACEGLNNVSSSQVAVSAKIQFFDGIPSETIQKLLVRAAADLINETTPDYQYVAGRLLMFDLRKRVFGQYEPEDFYDHIQNLVKIGKYDKDIITKWSEVEIIELGNYINHERDMQYTYAAMMEWEAKYLVKDRTTGQHFESPQQAIMLIGMCLHEDEPVDIRMKYVKDFYDVISNGDSLPTPIMAGVRTPTRQFSSCVLIESGDSLDSINASSAAIVKYVSQRAGIGINAGRIRAIGSPIRGGEATHTGVIPFYKHFQTAVKSCSQGGVRGGAATLFYPFWHMEIESLLVLKNNKGTEDNRVRHLDYAVQFSKLAYERLLAKGNITLFSPHSVPELWDAFYAPPEVFKEVYERLEKNPLIPKKVIKADDLWSLFGNERSSTGRIYLQNVDHCNTNSPFDWKKAPLRQGNLCVEIVLPTKPLDNINDENGEIALCTLAAFNLANTNNLQHRANVLVRALDNLLDYQDYPVKAAEKNKKRRTLGVGVVNYAHWIAKNGFKYSDSSANNATHRLFEEIQYNLLVASCGLAKEKGVCEWFGDTTYSQGVLPIDRYNKNVDSIVSTPLEQDWEALRGDILKYGLRNSTLTALMPSETSSKISNATNGIEPVRGYVVTKGSKDGRFKQVVPMLDELWGKYEIVWDTKINKGYIELAAIMQKFVDQTISANTNYDPRKYTNGKVPLKEVLQDLLYGYKLGVKTFYYHNTRDGSGEDVGDDGCESGACKI
jgi:ribonucleoside-diphosphate reductase alpha chain